MGLNKYKLESSDSRFDIRGFFNSRVAMVLAAALSTACMNTDEKPDEDTQQVDTFDCSIPGISVNLNTKIFEVFVDVIEAPCEVTIRTIPPSELIQTELKEPATDVDLSSFDLDSVEQVLIEGRNGTNMVTYSIDRDTLDEYNKEIEPID